MQQALKDGTYDVPGGYKLYQTDMEQLERAYNKSQARGVMKESVLREFLEGQKTIADRILALDTKLDEQTKKFEGLYQHPITDTEFLHQSRLN